MSIPSLKTLVLVLAATWAALAAPTWAADATREVSLQSLLGEMIDRDAAAQWPAPLFACKQFSSHDRHKVDPADPKGWHSNVDYGNFIRTEVNQGRQEWVILDDTGPGTIARFWTPLLGEKDKQIIRFYFDGSTTPAIAVNFNELLSGQGFVRPPLAFVAWNQTDLRDELKPDFKARRGVAGDLYLPIPFAKSCKITLDSLPFYYVINYRIYEPGTAVRTFTMADFESARAAIDRVAKAWAAVQDSAPATKDSAPTPTAPAKQAVLAPNEELVLSDQPSAAAAIRSLHVQIDPKQAPQALRSVILQATFDQEATIWCPIGEFFGAGARLHPVRDWNRTVCEDGAMAARWVMPYQRSARVSLKNVGDKPVTVALAMTAGPWTWNDRSLYFHANWRCQLGLKTRPMSDWNYIQIQGRGKYVGDTLTVYSPVRAWYGEGDERIRIDGEAVASHIGTGTEDYYGYAWGMAGFFSSPFISMPQRDFTDQGDWRGYTTTSRLRLLDSIPFQTALQHDMEIWNWADTQVDYAVGTFWYARPGATHNRDPQPQQAASPIREAPGNFRIAGAIECETIAPASKSANLRISTQDAGLQEGDWSGGRQLFVQATKVGDYVELPIPVADAQPHKVTLYGTRSYDYGTLRFTVNGQPAGKDYDAYSPKAVASGPIELGTFEPKDGKLLLRIEVVGANPASRGAKYYFGLDCVTLGQP